MSPITEAVTCDRAQPRHYGDAGRRYFSVSSVLNVMHGCEHHGTAEDLARGTELHRLFAQMLTTGQEDHPSPYTSWQLCVRPFVERMRLSGAPIEVERTLVSPFPGMPFAGTVDVIWQIDGHELIDLKTGAPEPWHRVQVQAYDWLYQRVGGIRPKRLGILYAPHAGDEPPRYVPVVRNPRDMAAFGNALALLIYRETR